MNRLAKICDAKAALEQEAREQRARQLQTQAEKAEKTAPEHPSPRAAPRVEQVRRNTGELPDVALAVGPAALT